MTATKWKIFHSNHCMWPKHSFKFCVNVVPWQRANQLWHLNFTVQTLMAFKCCFEILCCDIHNVKAIFYGCSEKCEKWLLALSCLSVHPYGTTWLPLDKFLWNLIFKYLSTISQGDSSFIKNLARIKFTSHEEQCTFFSISRSFLLRMKNVSGKSCRENQNTHFLFNNFFFSKIVSFMK